MCRRTSTMKTHLKTKLFVLPLVCCIVSVAFSTTDPNDLDVLNEFRNGLIRNGLKNPELLQWPDNGDDPCGQPSWKHVFCENTRVTQIQVQGLGLKGHLPYNLNKLSELINVGLQRNQFSGKLPSFSGLAKLQFAYLDYNAFDSIPGNFFDGLSSLQVLALDHNNFNSTAGWMFPESLQGSSQLSNLSCMSCNLVGPLPGFLGNMSSLTNLRLSDNSLSGEIPPSFGQSQLRTLSLNNQRSGGLTGSIDVLTLISSLEVLWLQGNQFSGPIPESVGNLTLLKDLDLNGNKLVGLIPQSLADLLLDRLDLNNNLLMGPIPEFKVTNVIYAENPFCQTKEGFACAPEVMTLIEFLRELNYPPRLASEWVGNDPCGGSWLGLRCNAEGKIEIMNLPRLNLTGTLSPSVAKLGSLSQIRFQFNHINGPIPENWTALKSLKTLDLSGNNISPPLPKFSKTLDFVIDGNPLFSKNRSITSPSPMGNLPSSTSGSPEDRTRSPRAKGPSFSPHDSSGARINKPKSGKNPVFVVVVAPLASVAIITLIVVPLSIYCCSKRRRTHSLAPNPPVIHSGDRSDSDNLVKIAVVNDINGSTSTGRGSASKNSSSMAGSHVIESGNLVISLQVLRNVTENFAPENELGRGGFGIVYKGELEDGTKIAVKRMQAGVISTKALNEFHAEISVLSKVRHRHLVSLLCYSIEGNERMLVYEYMPQGALSKHLFHWKSLKLEPLSWKRRLNIALDVARGMEYLHSLAHQSFIHRDLKSSNILLGDDFRAKISDFGLVKLAPDTEKSVVTRLAGTFGYLAPEYAVMGKITTKVDVFSFGVVLMELLTGLMALDEDRPEESQYLASWFWHMKSDKQKLRAAIDNTLDVKDETFESICVVAELAGHCTAREPNQRPDMSHAVSVLCPLVENWKPLDDETEEYSGIDYSLPLNQMVKGWQEAEGKEISYVDLDDSKGSIPSRPTGFAESFTSADGR
ncbi:PREDICTED: receptor-like kinase TMK3 isoform X1 [Tarenaya hassleriana]|uniref:receptor-like kinase TMK3 isoform X1 n=1 Tax=Tarenaya hassleriana TaxID=28532 RepID=UPI00053C4F89|nr:PREDICTED: receptor-like kinase TMK3 isoform X1 [Tarenaya hassleriana]XP_010557994.1 PREDICTED: receptor-like kinase TMK3 isoform X1 [Tarenaya hassleriana]